MQSNAGLIFKFSFSRQQYAYYLFYNTITSSLSILFTAAAFPVFSASSSPNYVSI